MKNIEIAMKSPSETLAKEIDALKEENKNKQDEIQTLQERFAIPSSPMTGMTL